MKPTADSTRLLDGDGAGCPDSLRTMLEAACDAVPTDAQVERLAQRLGPLFDPPDGGDPGGGDGGGGDAGAAGAGGASSIAPVASGAGASAWKIGAAVALLAGAGGVAISSRPNEPPVERTSVVIDSPAETAPVAASAAPVVTASPEPPPSSSSPPLEPAPPPSGETDIELLQAAQAALGPSPARALVLTQEHAARFPGSTMSQEREMIAINALLAVGRGVEARDRARRFIVRYPSSAHRQRLEAMLSEKVP